MGEGIDTRRERPLGLAGAFRVCQDGQPETVGNPHDRLEQIIRPHKSDFAIECDLRYPPADAADACGGRFRSGGTGDLWEAAAGAQPDDSGYLRER